MQLSARSLVLAVNIALKTGDLKMCIPWALNYFNRNLMVASKSDESATQVLKTSK
jgi:hypothetical protein